MAAMPPARSPLATTSGPAPRGGHPSRPAAGHGARPAGRGRWPRSRGAGTPPHAGRRRMRRRPGGQQQVGRVIAIPKRVCPGQVGRGQLHDAHPMEERGLARIGHAQRSAARRCAAMASPVRPAASRCHAARDGTQPSIRATARAARPARDGSSSDSMTSAWSSWPMARRSPVSVTRSLAIAVEMAAVVIRRPPGRAPATVDRGSDCRDPPGVARRLVPRG